MACTRSLRRLDSGNGTEHTALMLTPAHPVARTAVLLVLGSAALVARADVPVKWGGYGTLALYQARVRGASVRPDPSVAESGTEGEWRADGDSRLGLQGRARLRDGVEGVLQLSARDDVERRFRPAVEWAYLSWSPSDSLTLRLGRQTLPSLRYSETRSVGYAQTAVRPNPAVYALNPGTPLDGLNISTEWPVGQGALRFDVGIGSSSARRAGVQADARRIGSAALRWQGGDWTVQMSGSDYHLDFHGLQVGGAGLDAVCANCQPVLAQRAAASGIHGRTYNLSMLWERADYEVAVEVLWRPTSTSTLSPRGWGRYLHVARRWGDWRPYLAGGQLRYLEPPLGLAPVADASAAAAAAVLALDRYLQAPVDLSNLQLGVRHELGDGMALKLQWERWIATRDRTAARNGLVQLLTPPLGRQAPGWNGRAQLITLSADFVF